MYRITITREEDVEVKTQEWKQLYADQDTAAANGEKHTHGYVTKVEQQIRETQVLQQRVDDLDMEAVIVAINKIGQPKDQVATPAPAKLTTKQEPADVTAKA